MSLWKKILIALAITGTAGVFSTYSTVAVAAEDQAGSRKATAETIKVVEHGLAETKNGASAQEIKVYYFQARQEIKDITGETIARDLQYANDALFAVSRSLKVDDMERPLTAEEQAVTVAAWEEVLKILQKIKTKQH